jgi:magnesium transporter
MKLNITCFSEATGLIESEDLAILDTGEFETVWLDIETDSTEEFQPIADKFELHELTIEDCFTPNHSPKLENFRNYDFFVFRSLKYGTALETSLATEDWDELEEKHTWAVNIYLGYKFIITHRREEVPWLDAAFRQVAQRPERVFARGVDSLIHRIIDVMITRFMRSLRYYEIQIDSFEEQALKKPENFDMSAMLELKRDFTGVKQIMINQRAIIARLSSDSTLISSRLQRRYFKDIDDLAVAILNLIDKHLETLVNARDVYFAMTNVKLGDIMRVLAVITTVGVPLNVIVGLYGMNFTILPFSHHEQGFWMIVGTLLFLTLIMLFFFKRRGWL